MGVVWARKTIRIMCLLPGETETSWCGWGWFPNVSAVAHGCPPRTRGALTAHGAGRGCPDAGPGARV